MDKKIKRNIIIATVLIVVFLIIPMALTMRIYNNTFGVRVETDNDFYAFIQHEKPTFERKQTLFISNEGQRLTGYFYGYFGGEFKGLICVAHGMGDGHNNYITEIEQFAAAGYLVFSYDGTGSNESEGDKLIGLSQSPIDLKYALDYLDSIEAISQLPLVLYGHSWGGFAVATVGNYEIKNDIKAVISVAGFEKNTNVIKDLGKRMLGDAIVLFLPYVSLYEFIKFDFDAFRTGIGGLSKLDADVLIIHSENDDIVDYTDNFLAYKEAFSTEERVQFLSLKDNGHNTLLLPDADKKIDILIEAQTHYEKNSDAYQQGIYDQYKLTLQLDEDVMATILDFIDDAIKE